MTTLYLIGKKINYFFGVLGIAPKYIYLGRAELLAIKQETILHRTIEIGSDQSKTILLGYEVCEVDSDSHLSVGI